MANLIRTAKSGSDWTKNELLAYNIEVKNSSLKEFSDLDELPISSITIDGSSREIKKLCQYLDLASDIDQNQESAIDDFARELLRILGFEKDDTILRTRFSIPLIISGDGTRKAQTDVCLVRVDKIILLLLQEDKTLSSTKDPEPQVMAEAIAAFQYNNSRRINHMDKEELDKMVFPCITMIGTFPRFYLVPVTKELSDCVITGQYPQNTTVVSRYIPKIGSRRKSDGMLMDDSREVIIRCYEMFRIISEGFYSKFLE